MTIKTVLHTGCGVYTPEKLHPIFRNKTTWKEIRLDIDKEVNPEILCSIINMRPVESDSVDAVYSSHTLEHLHSYEVPLALGEFYRVLRPGGVVLITLPDIQEVAKYVAKGKLEDPLYETKIVDAYSGVLISPLDILYGHQTSIEHGKLYMAHRTAFTKRTLTQKLTQTGFHHVQTIPDTIFNLWAIGYKLESGTKPEIDYMEKLKHYI